VATTPAWRCLATCSCGAMLKGVRAAGGVGARDVKIIVRCLATTGTSSSRTVGITMLPVGTTRRTDMRPSNAWLDPIRGSRLALRAHLQQPDGRHDSQASPIAGRDETAAGTSHLRRHATVSPLDDTPRCIRLFSGSDKMAGHPTSRRLFCLHLQNHLRGGSAPGPQPRDHRVDSRVDGNADDTRRNKVSVSHGFLSRYPAEWRLMKPCKLLAPSSPVGSSVRELGQGWRAGPPKGATCQFRYQKPVPDSGQACQGRGRERWQAGRLSVWQEIPTTEHSHFRPPAAGESGAQAMEVARLRTTCDRNSAHVIATRSGSQGRWISARPDERSRASLRSARLPKRL